MVRPAPRRALAAAILVVISSGARAQTRDWTPSERAVIGDFSHVVAVAAGRERVFVVAPDAVLEYDPHGRRWAGPWQPPGGERLARVGGALADPLDGSLWLVQAGGWIRFDPMTRQWEEGTVPGGVIDAALDEFDPAGGLFLRTRNGWYSAQRGGIALPAAAPQRPVRLATVDDAIRSNPAIQATGATVNVMGRFRSVRFTSAAPASGFAGQGWYIGTSGVGLLYYPEGAGQPEPLLFGLPSGRVAAVFTGNDGVWVATARTPTADPSVSFVGTELERFTWVQGPRASGLPFLEARRMVGRGSDLWLATDNGALLVTPRDEDFRRFDESRGLPDGRVLDLAQRAGRIAAGTAHGVAVFDDSTGFVQRAPRFRGAALAVELSGDTVWVGTELGLFAALPGEEDLLQPDALAGALSLQAPVVDLAWRGDTLVALTRDRLLWRDPGNGAFTAGPLLGSRLGRLHTVVNGRGVLYLAGERGVASATLATPPRRALTQGDLPGRVTDLAVDEHYLWVATDNGLVRLSLDLVGR